MSTRFLERWIQHALEDEPLRAKSVVMTVFGDAITPHGGAVWLGSLIALLAPLGISERLVRTSVFRLVQDGWITAQREGRRSHYALSEPGQRRAAHAYRRVYHLDEMVWDRRWTIVMGTEQLSASQRALLRKHLQWEGCCVVGTGWWMRPSGKEDIIEDLLQRLGLSALVHVLSASDAALAGTAPVESLVASGWDLAPVIASHGQFVDRFGALPAAIGAAERLDPLQAFLLRTLTIHAFRRLQLHDPHLPQELLPLALRDARAYALCRDIYRRTHVAAGSFILAALREEDAALGGPDAAFYRRFGGLDATPAGQQ